jgi:DnaJ-class molecular chaperone
MAAPKRKAATSSLDSLGRKKCPTCKGSRDIACAACKGKGEQVVTNPTTKLKSLKACRSCGATGRRDCRTCDGYGTV